MVVTLIRDVTHTNVSLCLGSDTRSTHLLKDKLDDELASQLVHEGRTYVTYHVPHHTEPNTTPCGAYRISQMLCYIFCNRFDVPLLH